MKNLIWFAVAERQAVFQVDISPFKFVYDLQKAVANKTRYKILIPRIQIWKLNNPSQWPVPDGILSKAIPDNEDELKEVATRLNSHESLEGVLSVDYHSHNVSIVAKVFTKRKIIPLIPYPTRRIWCGIAGGTRILQIDIPLSEGLDDVKKAIAKEMKTNSREVKNIWKVNDPLEWSIDEGHKRLIFPKDDPALQMIASPLNVPLEEDMFDNVVRYYHVYLIVSMEKDGKDEPETAPPERLVWCITENEKRTFQVDITGCTTKEELLEAAVAKSGYKLRLHEKDIWVITEPQCWPISDEARLHEMIEKHGISRFSAAFPSLKPMCEIFDETKLINSDDIALMLEVYIEGPPQAHRTEGRFIWCVIGPQNYLARVDIEGCIGEHQILAAVKKQSGYLDMRGLTLWKIEHPSKYPVRDVAMGIEVIPNEIEDLQQIGDLAGSVYEDISDITYDGNFVYYIVHVTPSESISDSRTSSEPGLRPFMERDDIEKMLRALEFDEESIVENPSRPHVAEVLTTDGARYFAKYFRPNRCSEIEILNYLSKFDSPHIPSKIICRYLEEGTLLLIPHLGEPIDRYKHCPRDLLSITRQFLKGLAFLHSKLVAHLDLKPSHLVVNEDGHVTIIDYDLSMRFKDMTQLTSGFQGTKRYTAPEVGDAAYNPFLADIWAAGRTLSILRLRCHDHKDVGFLKTLTTKMMDDEASKRPSIRDAIQEIDDYINSSSESCPDGCVGYTTTS